MTGALQRIAPAASRTLVTNGPLDLARTLGHLVRGGGDPTMRVGAGAMIRASRTEVGPAAVEVRVQGSEIRASAWGPGAGTALDALAALLGLDDDDRAFDASRHPVIANLARRLPGLRIGRTGRVFEVLLPAVLEQRITGTEAARGYRRLIRGHGERAPGPLALWVPPGPDTIARLPSWAFPALGIEPRRGALLQRLARDASRLESLAVAAQLAGGGGAGAVELAARLRAYDGIGPWTAAEVTLRALGDPDAVSIGDAHLPNLVAWNLAGEPRATDERMLELLEPWRGQRARVIRLLETGGQLAPRFGPRVAPRDITRI